MMRLESMAFRTIVMGSIAMMVFFIIGFIFLQSNKTQAVGSAGNVYKPFEEKAKEESEEITNEIISGTFGYGTTGIFTPQQLKEVAQQTLDNGEKTLNELNSQSNNGVWYNTNIDNPNLWNENGFLAFEISISNCYHALIEAIYTDVSYFCSRNWKYLEEESPIPLPQLTFSLYFVSRFNIKCGSQTWQDEHCWKDANDYITYPEGKTAKVEIIIYGDNKNLCTYRVDEETSMYELAEIIYITCEFDPSTIKNAQELMGTYYFYCNDTKMYLYKYNFLNQRDELVYLGESTEIINAEEGETPYWFEEHYGFKNCIIDKIIK